MARTPSTTTQAFLVGGLGIGLYSVMDALMKGLAISLGAYNAALWRGLFGIVFTGVVFLTSRPRIPPAAVMRLHVLRGVVASVLVFLFFWGVARLPLAEGVALSFIAPLITLYLAAVMLGETVTGRAVACSVIGLVGVGVILAGRLGGPHAKDAGLGALAVLVSAAFYAYNLILQRKQAGLAPPRESAFFNTLFMSAALLLVAPVAGMRVPPPVEVPALIAAAVFAAGASVTVSWAYARAQAKVLVVLEYTAFIWAALFGLVIFHEPVTITTLLGSALIVAGCVLSAWSEQRHAAAAQAEVGV